MKKEGCEQGRVKSMKKNLKTYPSEPIFDQIVRHPRTRVTPALPRTALNLGPEQGLGLHGATVSIARCNVFLHWARVANRPGILFPSVSMSLDYGLNFSLFKFAFHEIHTHIHTSFAYPRNNKNTV